MASQWIWRSSAVAALLVCWQVQAAELKDCVRFARLPNGGASLSNNCSVRLNVSYCIDNPASTAACAKIPRAVISLGPGDSHRMPSYGSDGEGPIYQAVCPYPEAAVEWTPAPEAKFVCRKTCVMC